MTNIPRPNHRSRELWPCRLERQDQTLKKPSATEHKSMHNKQIAHRIQTHNAWLAMISRAGSKTVLLSASGVAATQQRPRRDLLGLSLVSLGSGSSCCGREAAGARPPNGERVGGKRLETSSRFVGPKTTITSLNLLYMRGKQRGTISSNSRFGSIDLEMRAEQRGTYAFSVAGPRARRARAPRGARGAPRRPRAGPGRLHKGTAIFLHKIRHKIRINSNRESGTILN